MTPLQYVLLGMLARSPLSGYDLTKLFERNLEHLWTAKHSQIYPELARLQDQGLINQIENGPRGRKTYQTTEAGLTEVRRWLRETGPERPPQNSGLVPIFLLWLLEKAEARAYLAREATYHRTQAEQLEQAQERIATSPWSGSPPAQSMAVVLEARLRYESAMAEWADWAITQFAEERSVPAVSQSEDA
jgi:DNA-binding PadR family transcriptional regulator